MSREDFIVPLPMKSESTPLGESRISAVRRFQSLEHVLKKKDEFAEFTLAMQEYIYFVMGHAEPVPTEELDKLDRDVYYFPMHVVKKGE